MANQGWFDRTATSAGWFDPTAAARGWFDQTFSDLDPVASGDPGTQPVQGTRSLRSRAATWRTAVLAASLVFATTVEAAPSTQPTQPDTWPQPISGVRSLTEAARAFRGRGVLAQLSYYAASDPLAVVALPDTWTSPVEGTRALGQAQRTFTRRAAQIGQTGYWAWNDLTSGPLPVQPDTWTQPVPGVANLGQQARAWSRIAAGMGRLWQTPQDLSLQPDTWTQPTPGTAALRSRAVVRQASLAQQASLWQTLPEEDGPLGLQPDTWPSPIPGLTSVRSSAQAVRTRAAQTLLYGQTAQDPPPIAPVDQWAQPIPGTAALRTASQQVRARAVTLAPLLWQTPEDVNGPLATPPDTWTQPIPGTASLAVATRALTRRAVLAQGLAQTVNDVPPAIEPETWTSPIVGLSAIRQQQRAWRETTTRLSPRLYWQAIDLTTGPLAAQPDTWVQPIEGLRVLRTLQHSLRTWARRAGSYLWQRPPEDLSGLPPIFAQTRVVGTSTPSTAVIATLTVGSTAYRAAVLGDGPTAYWRLDETGLVAVDLVAGATGALAGTVTTGQPGAVADGNPAMTFIPLTGQITVPDGAYHNFGTGPMSVECWFKLTSLLADMVLLDNIGTPGGAHGFCLAGFDATTLCFSDRGNIVKVQIPTLVVDAQWHHVVATLTRGVDRVDLYVDGALAATATQPAGIDLTPGRDLVFGNRSDGIASNTRHLDGSLDEIALYPVALTPTQIAAHYQIGIGELGATWITATSDGPTDLRGTVA